jgi:predicted RNA-binding protein with PIN domain
MLHFIVDGYNLLNRFRNLKSLSLQDRREFLLSEIGEFKNRISSRNRFTVVFDGSSDVFTEGPGGRFGIKVVFSCNQDADTLIKRFIDSSDNPKEIVLITDDREIIDYGKVRGVQRKSTVYFLGWMKEKRRPQVRGNNLKANLKDTDIINKEIKDIWKKKYS